MAAHVAAVFSMVKAAIASPAATDATIQGILRDSGLVPAGWQPPPGSAAEDWITTACEAAAAPAANGAPAGPWHAQALMDGGNPPSAWWTVQKGNLSGLAVTAIKHAMAPPPAAPPSSGRGFAFHPRLEVVAALQRGLGPLLASETREAGAQDHGLERSSPRAKGPVPYCADDEERWSLAPTAAFARLSEVRISW